MNATYLTEQRDGDTSTEELAQMLLRELAQGLDDMLLDGASLRVGVVGVVRDDGRREIGVVDRVVDRDGDFVTGVVVDGGTGNTSPHGLEARIAR